MNHQQVLKSALAGLPAEKAGFFMELGILIDETAAFEDHKHWMFLLLAKGCELIPPVMDKKTMAAELSKFVRLRITRIQQAAYSRDYVLQHGAPIAELATEFASTVSETALQAYKDGKLKSDEPEVLVYRWPYDDVDAFPYQDLDEMDDD